MNSILFISASKAIDQGSFDLPKKNDNAIAVLFRFIQESLFEKRCLQESHDEEEFTLQMLYHAPRKASDLQKKKMNGIKLP
jgi:hypothetical protein